MVRANTGIVSDILETLTKTQAENFSKTCFGHWLNVNHKKNNQLLIYTILASAVDNVANDLSLNILGKRIHFRQQEFCLVTPLRFGGKVHMNEWVRSKSDNPFRIRMFPDIPTHVLVKVNGVWNIFDKMHQGSLDLQDDDAVRICLLVLLDMGFLGRQLVHVVSDHRLKLVEHISICWNIFPWGRIFGSIHICNLEMLLSERKQRHDDKRQKGKEI
ncbi:phospholipase-like protein [Artemisia annua]|uniref:Phospholipase-like protein n=1 Tax=Artemisia annua TaxID=35608 RepID=A0A2U1LJN6_ARTAN|nr:phospholipase-like protein [Artemisia annua]